MSHFYLSSYRLLLLVLCLFAATAARGQQTGSKDFILQLDDYYGQIQWEQSIDRQTWTAVPNGSVGKLKLTPSQTTLYRAKVTDPGCSPVYTDVKAAYFDGTNVFVAKLIEGRVSLPAGSSVGVGTLNAVSFLEQMKVQADGRFQVLLPDSVEEDVLMITNSKEEVIMLGHYIGGQEEYLVSPATTSEALLIMYPITKPISTADKSKHKELYRKEAEYQTLVNLVAALNKEGLALFSGQHTDLIQTLGVLVRKSFNESVYQTEQINSNDVGPQSLADAPGPVYISGGGSSVTVENTAAFSYTGQIYRSFDWEPIGPKFNIAGSMVRGSSAASSLIKSWRGPVNVKDRGATYDLKNTYNLEPGQYEVRIRSGLGSGGPEDEEAFSQNMQEFLALVFTNFVGVTSSLQNGCVKSIIDLELTALNPFNMGDAIRDGSFFTNYFAPIIKEIINAGVHCSGYAFTRLGGMVLLVDKSIPVLWYAQDWVRQEAEIDGCQYLSPNYETSNCFVVFRDSTVTLKEKYFPGDTVEVKLKAIENEEFYPYTSNAAGFRYMLLVGDRGSGFVPDRNLFEMVRTDVNGEASTKWILSCDEGKNSVTAKAALTGKGNNLKKDLFVTNTHVPVLKVVAKLGDHQMGEKGKVLDKPIGFAIRDSSDGLLTKLNRFKIKWEVLKNGEWEEIQEGGVIKDTPSALNKYLFVSKDWKLADVDGTQKIRATIEDKCEMGWKIEGNPVIFTANMDSCLSLSSQQYQYLTSGNGWLLTEIIHENDQNEELSRMTDEEIDFMNKCGNILKFNPDNTGQHVVYYFVAAPGEGGLKNATCVLYSASPLLSFCLTANRLYEMYAAHLEGGPYVHTSTVVSLTNDRLELYRAKFPYEEYDFYTNPFQNTYYNNTRYIYTKIP